MQAMKNSAAVSLFSPMPSTRIAGNSVRPPLFDWYFSPKETDSVSAAAAYPDSYSLIAVEREDEKGVSYGRLLFAASSLADVDFYVRISGGLDSETLHYVTGKNIS